MSQLTLSKDCVLHWLLSHGKFDCDSDLNHEMHAINLILKLKGRQEFILMGSNFAAECNIWHQSYTEHHRHSLDYNVFTAQDAEDLNQSA